MKEGDTVKHPGHLHPLGKIVEIRALANNFGDQNADAMIFVDRGDDYGVWKYHPHELVVVADGAV